ncbi:MAG: restriction endonuclease subunit S [Desulfobulbaceae bacterium]|jgi:type I restriction enzyme S subunit|nr:restriction endonuclease subunit S [Desulfobulbaceae bacterium]
MGEQTKKKVPEIRFKGFSEEWDEKPIGEVLTEKKRTIELEDNELYELVTVRRRNGGVVSRGHLRGKDILVKNYSQLKAGDFLISKRQVVHGATGIVQQHLDKAIVSNEYLVAVGNENISSEFLTIISTLPDMYRKFFLSSYGVDIEKLFFDAADWKKRNVVLPRLPEQNEICSYFADLDQMIGLHQRKHEKLVTLQKAMLKKMFPQNGATTPEIRFKGFFEPWDEKALGEISILLTGIPFESKKFTTSGIFLIRGMNVKRGYLDSSKEISEYWPSSYGLESYLLREDDIVIQMDGALIGKSYAKIKKCDLPALLVQRVTRVRCDKVYCDFICQQIQRDFSTYIRAIKTETAVPHLSLNDIHNFVVLLPSNEEQQKIGTYFRQLDELIAQYGTQVEKLKQIKTACLEKMFV